MVSIQIVLNPIVDLHFRQRPLLKINDNTGIFSNHLSWCPQEKQKEHAGLNKFRDWSWSCCFRKVEISGAFNKLKRLVLSANCSGSRSRQTFTKLPIISPSTVQNPISKYCTHAPVLAVFSWAFRFFKTAEIYVKNWQILAGFSLWFQWICKLWQFLQQVDFFVLYYWNLYLYKICGRFLSSVTSNESIIPLN